jgi:hypothetical protein
MMPIMNLGVSTVIDVDGVRRYVKAGGILCRCGRADEKSVTGEGFRMIDDVLGMLDALHAN